MLFFGAAPLRYAVFGVRVLEMAAQNTWAQLPSFAAVASKAKSSISAGQGVFYFQGRGGKANVTTPDRLG
jgi:hypothetical protein